MNPMNPINALIYVAIERGQLESRLETDATIFALTPCLGVTESWGTEPTTQILVSGRVDAITGLASKLADVFAQESTLIITPHAMHGIDHAAIRVNAVWSDDQPNFTEFANGSRVAYLPNENGTLYAYSATPGGIERATYLEP